MANNRRRAGSGPGKQRMRLNPWISFAFWAGVALIIYWTVSSDDSAPEQVAVVPPPPLNASATWATPPEGQALVSTVGYEASPIVSNYYVIFDGSGSMGDTECADTGTKLSTAQEALTRFAAAVPADANLGLLAFDDNGIRERVPLGRDNRADFVAAVDAVRVGGGTPLGSALAAAAAQLQQQAMQQLGYGDYNLVVVTDGYAEDPELMVEQVHALLSQTPVTLHTIGFCIDKSHALNMPGLVYYRSAMDPAELSVGLESVLAESPDFQVTDFGS